MTHTKRLCIALALAALILAAPNLAEAANNYTIQSHGTLVMKNADNTQSVEFYSEDIRYLQREIDALFAKLPGNYSTGSASMNYNTVTPTQRQPVAQENIIGNETVVTE